MVAEIRAKSKICTKKRIPITDPRIQELNETQLVLEMEGLNIAEEERYEDLASIFKLTRTTAINLLGLNLLPVEDEETGLLRRREDHEIIPLMIGTCREDLAKEIAEKTQDLVMQEEIKEKVDSGEVEGTEGMTADEFDEFMNADIEFMDDESEIQRRAIVNSPEYQYVAKNIVKQLSEDEEKQFEEVFGHSPNQVDTSHLEVPVRDQNIEGIEEPETFAKLRIEAEKIPSKGAVPKGKPQIIIEPEDFDAS